MYSPSKLPPKSSLRSTSNGIQVGVMLQQQQQQVEDSSRHSSSVCSDNHVNMDSSSSQVSSGLLRYRSAPSSFLASLVEEADDYLPRVAGSQEPDHTVLARYFSADSSSLTSESSSGVIQPSGSERSVAKKEPNSGFVGISLEGRNEEMGKRHQHLPSIFENGGSSFCNSPSQIMGYHQQGQGQDPRSGMEGSYRLNSPLGLSNNPLERVSSSNMAPCSSSSAAAKNNLTRHSSSPAGFLARLAAVDGQGVYDNGYLGAVRNMTNICSENRSCTDMVAPSRLATQMSFMKQGSSTTGLSSQLSDMSMPDVVDKLNMPVGSSAESLGGSSSDDGSLGNGNGVQRYMTGFPVGSWDDAAIVSESFASMQNGTAFPTRKRPRELNGKILSPLSVTESQKGEASSHLASALSHQFSLPKSPTEIAMEKLLQDSVPCKIRAKRGCATHPRSIAERVRRTRISERMRKLQELVPNMDKQTNTADMLDEAVEYIKVLRKQVQDLTKSQSSCTCSSKHASENT